MDGNGEQDEPAAKPKLRPANENPWYLLATIYGEQPENGDRDAELHAKNRIAWNRYMAGLIGKEDRTKLRELKDEAGAPRFSSEELEPYSSEEQRRLFFSFKNRGNKRPPSGVINFSDTQFARPFAANLFIFPHRADFKHATFSGTADFERATFSDRVDFTSATFSGMADFASATFSDWVDFEGATFSGLADFASATFSREADFQHANFGGGLNFTDTKFQGVTSFARAKFYTHPPAFHHAALREDTQWHGVDWPKIPSDREDAQEHLYNYERLKQEMERLKKQEDEQFFFTKELQCREVVDGFPKNLVSKAYGCVSFYGRSILRPLCGLGFAWLAGLLLLWPLGRTGVRGLKFTEAFGLSFYNLFPFLPYRKEIYTQGFLDELSRLAHIVAAGQAFAGAALLFLIGLALRNRFRMK